MIETKKIKLIESIGSGYDNCYIINGDNLKILSEIKEYYENKLNLIYIDPPYNTGKIMGKYKDSFKSHNDWLNFMRPRLDLAKLFLTDSGVILISIGHKEHAYLTILCNEIFGEENKLASITWQSKYTVSNDKIGISNQTEFILIYAKNIKNVKIKSEPLKSDYIKKAYTHIDPIRGLWRGGIQLYKKKNFKSYTVISPNGKKWTMPWNYSEQSWQSELIANDLIYWGEDGNECPTKKVFLKNNKGTGIKDLWLGKEVGYTADGGKILENMFGDRNSFLYPKPVSLMNKILEIFAIDNSTVMDFFAGSGTFGQAVSEYNIKYNSNINCILITNNENNICDNVTYPRMKNISNGYIDIKNKVYDGTNTSISYYKYIE